MATTVHFIQKNGTPAKATFPTRVLAESYARNVKGARFEDVAVQVAPVQVKACPVADASLQRAASSAYYSSVKEPKRGTVVEPTEQGMCAEQRAERMAEHFMEARLMSTSSEDAWSDWDHETR